MTEQDKSIEQRLHSAAKELLAKKGRLSEADLANYLAIIKELPTPDFSDWSEQERAGNTDRFKQARRKSRRIIGIGEELDGK